MVIWLVRKVYIYVYINAKKYTYTFTFITKKIIMKGQYVITC